MNNKLLKKQFDDRLELRINLSLKAKVMDLCQRKGYSLSKVVREALEQFIRREQ